MPNEFEKQVQQMMDELKLVPSEPVWQKVELQIRKKRDRRRVIFWISFLTLLLGGGLWFGIDQYSHHISYNEENSSMKKDSKEPNQNSSTNKQKTVEQAGKENFDAVPNNSFQTRNNVESYPEKTGNSIDEPIVYNKISKRTTNLNQTIPESKKNIAATRHGNEISKTLSNDVVADKPLNDRRKDQESITKPNPVSNTDSIATTAISDNNKITGQKTPTADSAKTDNISSKDSAQKEDTAQLKKVITKKYASSKWKLNFVASGGASNLNRLSVFNGEKALFFSAPNYNSGGQATGGNLFYYGPSGIKKGFSFSAGAIAKKQLSKQTFFSAGLQYNYYSNTIQVGNKINQSRTLMDFSVSNYYTNTATALRPYKNQYHFVSLPVAIDWQLLKKIPLNLHTGLAMQYLVKTNGLVFDYTSQSYFNSKDAFNRMQFFLEPALTYSIPLKQKTLSFGPQLQYGLTRLEKNSSTYHLSSFGLKAQLQLGKK